MKLQACYHRCHHQLCHHQVCLMTDNRMTESAHQEDSFPKVTEEPGEIIKILKEKEAGA